MNDVSRLTPYNYMLSPLLEELNQVGIKKENITFIIAIGIHELNIEKQNRRIFGDLSSGNTLYLNKEV